MQIPGIGKIDPLGRASCPGHASAANVTSGLCCRCRRRPVLPDATCFTRKTHDEFVLMVASALRGGFIGPLRQLGRSTSSPAIFSNLEEAARPPRFVAPRLGTQSLARMGPPSVPSTAPLALLGLCMPSATEITLAHDPATAIDLTAESGDRQHHQTSLAHCSVEEEGPPKALRL